MLSRHGTVPSRNLKHALAHCQQNIVRRTLSAACNERAAAARRRVDTEGLPRTRKGLPYLNQTQTSSRQPPSYGADKMQQTRHKFFCRHQNRSDRLRQKSLRLICEAWAPHGSAAGSKRTIIRDLTAVNHLSFGNVTQREEGTTDD